MQSKKGLTGKTKENTGAIKQLQCQVAEPPSMQRQKTLQIFICKGDHSSSGVTKNLKVVTKIYFHDQNYKLGYKFCNLLNGTLYDQLYEKSSWTWEVSNIVLLQPLQPLRRKRHL